jgi:hypothetical protein
MDVSKEDDRDEIKEEPKFYGNQYWEHYEWHKIDDVLKEFGF